MLKRLCQFLIVAGLFQLLPASQKVSGSPNLVVDILTNPERPQAGSDFSYRFTVTNAGSAAANNVAITNLLDERLELLSVTATHGELQRSGSAVIARVAVLFPASVVSIEMLVRANTLGMHPVSSTAMADEPDLVAYDNHLSLQTEILPGSNAFPTVALDFPASDTVAAFSDVPVEGLAVDPDGSIAHVEVLVNDTPLGEFPGPDFRLTWSKAAPGKFVIRVIATDDKGAKTTGTREVTVTWEGGPGFILPKQMGTEYRFMYVPEPGRRYRVDGSTDAADWSEIAQLAPGRISAELIDPFSSGQPRRFYRAVKLDP